MPPRSSNASSAARSKTSNGSSWAARFTSCSRARTSRGVEKLLLVIVYYLFVICSVCDAIIHSATTHKEQITNNEQQRSFIYGQARTSCNPLLSRGVIFSCVQ